MSAVAHSARNPQSAEQRIAALVAAVEGYDDARLAPARELVQRVLELHSEGLAAILAAVSAADPGGGLMECLLADRRILPVLLLHGVHPHSLEQRTAAALAHVHAELGVHGARIELLEALPQRVRLRIQLSADGASRSVAVLRDTVEAAVLGLAPEVQHVEIEGLPENGAVTIIPVSSIRKAQ